MPIEVACGSCHGRMLVDAAGTFACPHCGVHVAVSGETFPQLGASRPAEPSVPASPSATPGGDDASRPETAPTRFLESDEMFQSAGFATSTWDPAQVTQSDEFPEFSALGTADAEVPSPGDTTASREAPGAEGENVFMPDFSATSGTALDDDEEQEDLIQGGLGSMFGSDAAGTKSSSNVFAASGTSGKSKPGSNGSAVVESSARVTHDSQIPAVAVVAAEPVATPSAVLPASAIPIFIPASRPELSRPAPAPVEVPGFQPFAGPVSAPPPVLAPVPAATVSSRPAASQAATKMVPLQWLIVVGSYASAVTIMCIWLYLRSGAGSAHQLESLPDVEMYKNKGKIIGYVVPADVGMPEGHTLAIGGRQRYGNILVEVEKITRSPVEFEHYDGDESKKLDPGGNVLKLWLKLTNVSQDQAIVPLGSKLVYDNRELDRSNFAKYRANNFVCRVDQKRRDGKQVEIYHLNLNDNWNLRGQDVNRELQPGESFTTYLATTEAGIGEISGDCVWRVHLRKGFGPKGLGVTTIFEVAFSSSQVRTGDAAAETPSKPAAT